MRLLLPHRAYTRKQFQKHVKVINKLRNRIAHHEPILSFDVSTTHKDMLDIVEAACPETMRWVKHYSTVNHKRTLII